MKVLFIAPIPGVRKYSDHYHAICKTCQKLGHEVISSHVLNKKEKDFTKLDEEGLKKAYSDLTKLIKKSDAAIAEITYPSTTVGSFINAAVQNFIPTLVLHQRQYHGLIYGRPNRLIRIKTYSIPRLEKIIKKFLDFAEKNRLRVRFNMMLSENLSDFLSLQSKKFRISRAGYIRKVIEEKMKEEKY